MAKRRLALTKDGKITWCTAPEDKIGFGRCNHVEHQRPGEDAREFIQRVECSVSTMRGENSGVQEQSTYIKNIVSKYGRVYNPDWKRVIQGVPNPFVIGSKDDGTYEEAEMVDFKQEWTEHPEGDTYHLVATYRFRGVDYECDYGEVPVVAEDGSITINGGRWHVVPVVDQNKAGVISNWNTSVIRQEDRKNVAMVISKDPDDHDVTIYGKKVPEETVLRFWKTGDTTGLNSGQIFALSHVDPVAFQRFPEMKEEGFAALKELPPDEPNDIEWRPVIRYEDMVQQKMAEQMRRMGVTFRSNLSRRAKNGDGMTEEELNERFPLFYQQNLTENIKSNLVGRSNVQSVEDLNPLSALSQNQKISFTGPGGFHKDKAPYELRMPHASHEGLIDSMDVSAGHNVGLTANLYGGYIGEDRFIHKYPEGHDTLSPSDFIPYKYHDDPSRGTMAVGHLKQACPIIGGEDPLVSTPAWDNLKGAGLGLNLNSAYLPDKDCYEDAVVISKSAARSMGTIQPQKYRCYDDRGLSKWKVGDKVTRKTRIGGVEVKYNGTISEINNESGEFKVDTLYEMGVGDKLSNRHGAKSVVSKVRDDDDMPKMINPITGQAERVDIIMSPLSVAGRKNLGQVMECNENMGRGPVVDAKSKVVHPDGTAVEATSGKQYILRLNHIAEKKMQSHADELERNRESSGARLGEMEALLLSSDEDRLKILNYLRHQDSYDSHNRLHHLLKSVGVDLTGVNWSD